MKTYKRHLAYLKYVLRHKWFVFKAGRKLGVPINILIFHDWDKFLPDEWFPYARTFYTPDGKKQYNKSDAFAHAWMKHQHRNRHHWQWWLRDGTDITSQSISERRIIVWDTGEAYCWHPARYEDTGEWTQVSEGYLQPQPMREVYMREMLADWRGAGQALGKPDTLSWYIHNCENIILHRDTRIWIEGMLLYGEYDPGAETMSEYSISQGSTVKDMKDYWLRLAEKSA